MLEVRVAAVTTALAGAAYLAWTAAVADQADTTALTVLTAGIFWISSLVTIFCLGRLALRRLRSRR